MSAKRDSVKQILKAEVSRLEQKKAKLVKDSAAQQARSNQPTNASLRTVSNFAWDQTKEFVKVYIEFGDEPVTDSDVTLDIPTKRSFTLVFGTRKFSLNKLNADVTSDQSYTKLTKSRIIVYLKKEKEGVNWPNVKEKLNAYKEVIDKEKEELGDDPNAGLMKMMKKMYDEGDDEMKRTIAKSWYESSNKSGDGGGSAMPNMMGNMTGGLGDL